jgi:hypothetical protein
MEPKPDPNAPSVNSTVTAAESTPVTNGIQTTTHSETLSKEADKLATDLANDGEMPTATLDNEAGADASRTTSSDVNSTGTEDTDQSKGRKKSKMVKLKQKLHIGKSQA